MSERHAGHITDPFEGPMVGQAIAGAQYSKEGIPSGSPLALRPPEESHPTSDGSEAVEPGVAASAPAAEFARPAPRRSPHFPASMVASESALVASLESLGIAGHHAHTFAQQQVAPADLECLSTTDLRSLGLGWAAIHRMESHRLRAEMSTMVELLRMRGILHPSPALLRALRDAGAESVLDLWRVRESGLHQHNLPPWVQRAVLNAATETRDLAQLLSALGLASSAAEALLLELMKRGIDVAGLLSRSVVELIDVGLPLKAAERLQGWVDTYAREPSGPATTAVTPLALTHKFASWGTLETPRQTAGRRLIASLAYGPTNEMTGDLKVALALCGKAGVSEWLAVEVARASADLRGDARDN